MYLILEDSVQLIGSAGSLHGYCLDNACEVVDYNEDVIVSVAGVPHIVDVASVTLTRRIAPIRDSLGRVGNCPASDSSADRTAADVSLKLVE